MLNPKSSISGRSENKDGESTDNKIRHLVEVDDDILDKIVTRGEDSDTVAIKTTLSSPIITISAKANVRQALELMRLNTIKRLPVTDNIHILGR